MIECALQLPAKLERIRITAIGFEQCSGQCDKSSRERTVHGHALMKRQQEEQRQRRQHEAAAAGAAGGSEVEASAVHALGSRDSQQPVVPLLNYSASAESARFSLLRCFIASR